MELNWLESIIFGLLSGLGEILPVSARAHGILLLKIFGAEDNSHLFYLLVHLALLAAVYISCLNQIVRYLRARSISRIPKKKRKRPLDIRSLMDSRFLITMMLPVIVAGCQGLDLNPLSSGSSGNWYSTEDEIVMALRDLYRAPFWPVDSESWTDDYTSRDNTGEIIKGTLNGQSSTVTDYWSNHYK